MRDRPVEPEPWPFRLLDRIAFRPLWNEKSRWQRWLRVVLDGCRERFQSGGSQEHAWPYPTLPWVCLDTEGDAQHPTHREAMHYHELFWLHRWFCPGKWVCGWNALIFSVIWPRLVRFYEWRWCYQRLSGLEFETLRHGPCRVGRTVYRVPDEVEWLCRWDGMRQYPDYPFSVPAGLYRAVAHPQRDRDAVLLAPLTGLHRIRYLITGGEE